MTYLVYVYKILIFNPTLVAVALGNMAIYYSLFKVRFRWWLYPLLVSLTFLSLPLMIQLGNLLSANSLNFTILAMLLGYLNIINLVLCFKDTLSKILAVGFVLGIINRLLTFMAYLIHVPMNMLFNEAITMQFTIALFITLVYFLMTFVLLFFFKNKALDFIDHGLDRQHWIITAWIGFAAKSVIDLSSDFAFNLNPYSDTKIILTMIALSIFVIALLVIYVTSTFTLKKNLQLQNVSDRLQFEKQAQQRFYESQLHNQEEIKRMKHDMNGVLSTLSNLVVKDHIQEAQEYLVQLTKYTLANQKKLFSFDPYLNAVVAQYSEVFEKHDVLFEIDIRIGKLNEHHIEMCLMLNNALENALEASLKLPSDQRKVVLQVKSKQNKTLFRITNNFNHPLNQHNNTLFSTKQEQGHGYGLQSITKAAESVGGFVVHSIEDNLFILDVAM